MRAWIGSWLLGGAVLAAAGLPGAADTAGAAAAGRMLDDWHAAAAAADEARYFGHFAPGAVFLGTDGTERWSLEQFRAYAHPHFAAGRGWTYTPSERHVRLAAGGDLAWFDEKLLSEKHGELRGTGVLLRAAGEWKIVHYSMTFLVPNDAAAAVAERVRAGAAGR
jgi:ketosteroid isomerase-like protein